MGRRLFIGKLPPGCTEQEIRELFATVGPVKSVSIKIDRETGRPRGFGFVLMETEASAQRAINTLHGYELRGRIIRVVPAQRRDRPGERSEGTHEGPSPAPPAGEVSPQRLRGRTGRLPMAWGPLGLVALLVMVAGGVGWFVRRASVPLRSDVVLVLPLDVYGKPTTSGHLVAQQIAQHLRAEGGLRVPAVPEGGEVVTIEERFARAEKVGAAWVVVGAVELGSASVGASVTLLDTAQRRVVWGTEVQAAEIMTLAERLAGEILQSLEGTRPPKGRAPPAASEKP